MSTKNEDVAAYADDIQDVIAQTKENVELLSSEWPISSATPLDIYYLNSVVLRTLGGSVLKVTQH